MTTRGTRNSRQTIPRILMSDDYSSFEDASQPEPSAWTPCAHGELVEFGQRTRARGRMERMNKLATCGMVLLVAGVIAFTAGQHLTSETAHVDCGDVHGNMAQYITGNLDSTLASRIDHHLAYCLGCNAEYHQRTDIAHHARCDSEFDALNSFAGRVPSLTRNNQMVLHDDTDDCHCPSCWQFAVRLDEEE